MKVFDELLGFAVLTGPLWLIIVLLILGIWLAFKVAKRLKSTGAKIAGGLVTVALVLILPFADEIAGRIYLRNLCATQAGAKVYQSVELPAEYWDAEGKPRFLKPNGDLDKAILGNRFSEPATKKIYSNILGIDEYRHQVTDGSTRQNLGEVINFMYWGGWISRNTNPAGPNAVRCTHLGGSEFWRHFYLSLFQKTSSTQR